MPEYQPKGWEKRRDGSGGLFGGKHTQPRARDPRPKGAQRGVVRRDGQNSVFNTGSGMRYGEASGCLMALAMLPFAAVVHKSMRRK